MKLSSIKKSVADGAGITGQTLIYDSAVSTGSNTFLPVGLYGDSIEGTYAFTTNQDKLYLHTGQGWFNVAIVNTNPTFTTSPAGSYELATDATAYLNGTATTITLAATDPEGMPITWGYSANTAMNNIAHISNDSSVYTIEPKTADSAGSNTPDAGTLTFTASDGINIASAASTFTLTFDTTVANSEGTTLLLRGVGDSTTKNANVDDVSDANNTVIVNGNPYMGHFSPYNSAGYSTHFVDGNDNYIRTEATTTLNLANNTNWTVEGWYYFTIDPNTHYLFSNDNGNFSWSNINYMCYFTSSTLKFEWGGGQHVTMDFSPELGRWYHLAWSCDGTTIRAFIDGDVRATSTGSTQFYTHSSAFLSVGRPPNGHGSSQEHQGYVRDFRVVVGTCVYNANFVPPIQPLTAITNTKLLTCNDPYIYGKDTSGNLTLTSYNNIESRPFTPYKHNSYDASKYGGSIFMDGTDYLTTSGTANTNTTAGGAWTVEYWVYPQAYDTNGNVMFDFRAGGSGAGITAEFTSTGNIYMNSGNSGYISNQDYDIVVKQWYHMAFVHTGSVLKFYLNGIEKYTNSHTSLANDNSSGVFGIGYKTDGSKKFKGYISDFRFVAGKAVYTGAFTPPSEPLTKTGGTYPSTTNVVNPTASETKYLANFTNGDIVDLSGTVNFGLGPNSNAQSDTGNQKYGVPSVLFDGSGDVLTLEPFGRPFLFPNDFTIECWAYVVSGNFSQQNSQNRTFFFCGVSGQFQFCIDTSGNPLLIDNNGTIVTSSTALTGNSWQHIAATRSGDQVVLFLDGVEKARATHTTEMGGSGSLARVGALSGNSGSLNGALSDLRITKGLSRYPFIPLKETLTTSTSVQDGITCTASNVKLLALTTATITTDASAENHTITNVNSTAASTYGPGEGMRSALFAVASDNKLTIPDGEWKTLGSTFTFEAWVYPNSLPHSSHNYIFGDFNSAGANASNSLSLAMASDGLRVLGQSGGSDFTLHASTTVALNQWYHVAVVRNSGNFYIFLDGTMVLEETTKTGTLTNSSQVFAIGGTGAFTTLQWDGYISNFRFNNAQALYTKNFTVPSIALKG